MLFNSFEFLIFFPIVTIIYFLIADRARWFILLVASCIFYMFFKPIYILILFFTILIDYFSGIFIEKATTQRYKKIFLIASLLANIGVLSIFKYFNFLNENISFLLNSMGYINPIPYLTILLPIGLSFHTFQAMSYTIEVYRGHQKAERHFGIYALYVMFYPQLVAGPIERPQNVLHQFHEKHYFNFNQVSEGLKLMAWGLFKKVVIADRLSELVNKVYNDPYNYEGLPLLVATIFFSIQIYCDFSGYSDIALGSAQVMGFSLMKNFNLPYFAKTIPDFWKRWHISLSTWFRDYLYIPLGGNRVKKWRWYFNILTVFIISGFWHGANWTFIVWGSLHGFYQIFGFATKKIRNRLIACIGLSKFPILHNIIQVSSTFILVAYAWIFFRANTIKDAIYISTNIFNGLIQDIINSIKNAHSRKFDLFLNQPSDAKFAFIIIFTLISIEFFNINKSIHNSINNYPLPIRLTVYSLFIVFIVLFGNFSESQFIYFQF